MSLLRKKVLPQNSIVNACERFIRIAIEKLKLKLPAVFTIYGVNNIDIPIELIQPNLSYCESRPDIQVMLLVQTVLHLVAFSAKSGRKYHPVITIAMPMIIYYLSPCVSSALIISVILGLGFILASKLLKTSYLSLKN